MAIAVMSVSLGVMSAFGLFTIPKDDNGAKTLAASLGLVGSVFTGVVALVGTILKYSIDDRASVQAAVDSDRVDQRAREEGFRSRVDVALRAVDLLGENNKDATESQRAGAILALVTLGETDLAVALISELWPKGMITVAVASQVLEAAFRTTSATTHVNAAIVMFENARRLGDSCTNIWPFEQLVWPTELDENCRLALVLAAAGWFKEDITRENGLAYDSATVLYEAMSDPDPVVADIAASVLRPWADHFPNGAAILTPGGGTLAMSEIRQKVAATGQEKRLSQYAKSYETEVLALVENMPRQGHRSDLGKAQDC